MEFVSPANRRALLSRAVSDGEALQKFLTGSGMVLGGGAGFIIGGIIGIDALIALDMFDCDECSSKSSSGISAGTGSMLVSIAVVIGSVQAGACAGAVAAGKAGSLVAKGATGCFNAFRAAAVKARYPVRDL